MHNEFGDSRIAPSQLHAVLEGVQDALIVTDPSGTVVFMNTAAIRLYELEGQEGTHGTGFDLMNHVLGESEVSTLEGEPIDEEDHPLLRALRGEEYADVELLVRRKGRENACVYVFSGKQLGTEPPLSVLTIRDETPRWRAERRYRVAFEVDPAPSVIAVLDSSRIVDANEGMCELTGLSRETLQERSLGDIKPLQRADDLNDVVDRLREGERIHKVRRLLLNSDGAEVPVLLSARSIEVEGQSCGIFTFIDMSEMEAAKREQRETRAELNSTLKKHADEKAAMDRLAITDSLTGVANRRGLNVRLSEERARAQRYDDTFSILVLDLDRFKSVNDTFGHAAGDQVLREVARLLQDECREPDLAGRWGGEEFMMILPQVDLQEAAEVAERIRERVKNTVFGDGVSVTISIGVASYGDGHTTGGLFAQADRALYAAKEGGRDRVELASSGHEGA